jgi:hypothetical protein
MATQASTEVHVTNELIKEPPPADMPVAPLGRGSSAALHVPPDNVSMRPWSVPDALYWPIATQVPAAGHERELEYISETPREPLLGSGASSALHVPPDRVSRRPCVVTELSV